MQFLARGRLLKNLVSENVVSKKKKFESNWSLSIYNLYNRQNPYFIYFDIENNLGEEDGSIELKAKQVSLFPIIPSISWNFKF